MIIYCVFSSKFKFKFAIFYAGVFLLPSINGAFSVSDICDRRPLGAKSQPLPPDSRYSIDIIGINDDKYIPDKRYDVKLSSKDSKDTFIAFTISAKEDEKENEENPRRPIRLQTGQILPSSTSVDGISSPNCNNTIIQGDIKPKNSVEAIWIAPPKNNKCVTIYALIALKTDVWYNYDGPLSKRVCEDRRNNEDIQPPINSNCQICEEARYQLVFEGLWSYNTHPLMFPVTKELARFSDLVGASHSREFHFWNNNEEASYGLKMLAEQGNTTKLEMEIQEAMTIKNHHVRTLIKATGQPWPNMTTSAIFRASKEHHLVSVVAAIIPSPDWFLGVANMEMCEVGARKWADNITFNLYPLDAGTDSGASFESPNEGTAPPKPVSKAVINRNISKEDIKPFAKLHFHLTRTYPRPSCIEAERTDVTEDSAEVTTSEEIESSTPLPPIIHKVDETVSCPMTEWEEWQPPTCQGQCVDGIVTGYQIRFRYHIVNGRAVDFTSKIDIALIPEECRNETIYNLSDFQACTEDCSDTAQNVNHEENAMFQYWNNN